MVCILPLLTLSAWLIQGCLPQRLGNCVSTVWIPLPQAANLAPLLPHNSILSARHSASLTPGLFLIYWVSTRSLLYPLVNQLCAWDSTMCTTPEFPFELPAFLPAMEPTFTLGPCVSVTLINSLNAAFLRGCTLEAKILQSSLWQSRKVLCFWTCKIVTIKLLPQTLPWNPSLRKQPLFYLLCCYGSLPSSQKSRTQHLPVQVFNSHAPSKRHPSCYRKHKLEKKHHYEQRVREVEHASFTPLV